MYYAIALADIISYMEDAKYDQSVAPVFKMPEITNMSHERLKQLGLKYVSTVYSTKLKIKLVANFPDLQALKEGCANLLVFNKDVGLALKIACEEDGLDFNCIQIHKVAKLIRKEFSTFTKICRVIFVWMPSKYSSSVSSYNCQYATAWQRFDLRCMVTASSFSF